MQRHTVLVLLWFFLGLLICTTHARHNITAALVALAPVSDTDVETSLNVDDKDGNGSSTVTANWILLSTVVTLQSILLLLRWFKGPYTGKFTQKTIISTFRFYRVHKNRKCLESGHTYMVVLFPGSSISSVRKWPRKVKTLGTRLFPQHISMRTTAE